MSDGTLWCWGANESGQLGDGTAKPSGTPVRVIEGKDWRDVAAGSDFTCGIRSDDTLWCWGHWDMNKVFAPQVFQPGAWARVTLSRSGPVMCAISIAGELFCTSQFPRPMNQIGADTDWMAVSMGGTFVCGLRVPGSLWCWGEGSHGSLADGNPDLHYVDEPQRAGDREDYTALSCGTSFCCGLTTGGAILCWGNGYKTGALGNPMPPTSVAVPTQVGTSSDFKAVGAGTHTACGVRTDGTLTCWGVGLVGDGTVLLRETPTAVAPGTRWSAVFPGNGHSCGLHEDGTAWCWGSNESGQLGHGAVGAKGEPTQVGEENTYASVAVGGCHTCALKKDGSLVCFGLNSFGQLGIGTLDSKVTPAPVPGSDWKFVAAGSSHTCGLRNDGSTWCWGSNEAGSVGDKTNLDKKDPTQVEPLSGWETLALGSNVSCGLRQDHGIWCWGNENLSSPKKVGGAFTALSAALSSCCGLAEGGIVKCDTLPDNSLDRDVASDPAFVSVAGHQDEGCALTSEGALVCWGLNDGGQLGIGSAGGAAPPTPIEPESRWLKVVVASGFKCGIKADHTLWCWGGLTVPTVDGPVVQPSQPTRVGDGADWTDIAVSKPWAYAAWGNSPPTVCGIREPGTLWCWGSNRFGQLGDGTGGHLVPVAVEWNRSQD